MWKPTTVLVIFAATLTVLAGAVWTTAQAAPPATGQPEEQITELPAKPVAPGDQAPPATGPGKACAADTSVPSARAGVTRSLPSSRVPA